MIQPTPMHPVFIRPAREADRPALRRLAELDSARLPEGDVLVAEVDGELRAALRVTDRAYVADPFYPSRELVELLAVRADAERAPRVGVTQRARRLLAPWRSLWRRPSSPHPAR